MEPLDPVLARGRAAAKGACRKRPLVWGEAESPAVRKGPSRRGGVQATGSRPDCRNEAPTEIPTHSPPRPLGSQHSPAPLRRQPPFPFTILRSILLPRLGPTQASVLA